MKTNALIILIITMLLIFSSCSTQNSMEENRYDSANTYNIVSQKFQDENVEICYPNISGLQNAKIESLINVQLKSAAFRELTSFSSVGETNTEGIGLDVEYKILYQSSNYLCVNYTGDIYKKDTAYPRSLFTTLNIDLNSGNRLQLSDIINIDNEFVDKIREALKVYIDKNPDGAIVYNDMLGHDNDYFLELFIQADSELKEDCFSYFTKDSLGISFATSHVAGDHFEIELKYTNAKGSIKTDHEIWKD